LAADGSPSFVYVPALPAGGGTIEIAGEEAHYLARVVRVRPGERVVATDGAGTEATLEIVAVLDAGGRVSARVLAQARRSAGAELELWCGAPEGDRADWLVEKLAELGVTRLQLVDGARGRWERFAARRQRWERLAIAALRQSRSAHRLVIAPPVTLAAALAGAGEAAARWICSPDAEPAAGRVRRVPGRAIAVVGPSSGFSPEELNALREAGFTGIALAGSRLRTETAALAVAAVWAAAEPVRARDGPSGRTGA
jgi:16S rRNA (uracil1498-N3)-methyltransferase